MHKWFGITAIWEACCRDTAKGRFWKTYHITLPGVLPRAIGNVVPGQNHQQHQWDHVKFKVPHQHNKELGRQRARENETVRSRIKPSQSSHCCHTQTCLLSTMWGQAFRCFTCKWTMSAFSRLSKQQVTARNDNIHEQWMQCFNL